MATIAQNKLILFHFLIKHSVLFGKDTKNLLFYKKNKYIFIKFNLYYYCGYEEIKG